MDATGTTASSSRRTGPIGASLTLGWMIAAAAALVLLPGVWLRDIWVYNEGRRAIIALEMLQRGEWIVPRLMGEPILTKPPLFYWLEAVAFAALGVGDATARLPSALAAVGVCVVLFRMLDRMLRDRAAAALGALAAAVMPIHVWMAQQAEPEMVFVFFGVWALERWSRAAVGEGASARTARFDWAAGGLALGLSLMTKGPLVPIATLLALAAWTTALPRERRPTRRDGVAAAALCLAPGVVWLALLAARGYPPSALMHEMRTHLGEDAPHVKGFFFYLGEWDNLCFPWPYCVVGALVAGFWTLFTRRGESPGMRWALWRWSSEGRGERLLLIAWFAATWLVFSVVPSKRYYYGLALAPPTAGLIALLAREAAACRWPVRPRGAWALAVVGLALVAAGAWAPAPQSWNAFSGESSLDGKALLLIVGAWLLGAGVWAACRGALRVGPAFAWMAAVMAATAVHYTFAVHRRLDAQLSYRRVADDVRRAIPPGAGVFSIQSNHTIWFYLRRPDVPVLRDADAVRRYASAHPGDVAVVTREYLDLARAAGPFDVLYRSDFIAVRNAQVYVLRWHPGPR